MGSTTQRHRALAALLLGMGTLHLVAPGPFERLIPPVLGWPRPWVVASGVAELAAGAALVPERTRRAGAWAAAATLVAVFPGNVTMALDAGAPVTPAAAALWLRLPLQAPLVAWALRLTGGRRAAAPARGRRSARSRPPHGLGHRPADGDRPPVRAADGHHTASPTAC